MGIWGLSPVEPGLIPVKNAKRNDDDVGGIHSHNMGGVGLGISPFAGGAGAGAQQRAACMSSVCARQISRNSAPASPFT